MEWGETKRTGRYREFPFRSFNTSIFILRVQDRSTQLRRGAKRAQTTQKPVQKVEDTVEDAGHTVFCAPQSAGTTSVGTVAGEIVRNTARLVTLGERSSLV